jgi:hypothetical protein
MEQKAIKMDEKKNEQLCAKSIKQCWTSVFKADTITKIRNIVSITKKLTSL